jgi:type III secretory pathway component EscV
MAIANQDGNVQRIVAALGLERVVSLTLHFEVNAMPMVDATFMPTKDKLDGVADALESKRYRLVEVESET